MKGRKVGKKEEMKKKEERENKKSEIIFSKQYRM